MVKSADSVSKTVASKARALNRYLNKMEALHVSGSVSRKDVERAYGGGFLEFHAYVENSIETLFLGLLRGRLKSSDSSVRSLVAVNSDQIARRLVQAGRPYVDWLPYKDRTEHRAGYFFSSGKPFSNLESNDLEAFKHAALIRNVLAHESSHSLKQFQKELVEGKALPTSEHRPRPYLRGMHTIGQTRMEYMLARLVGVMARLCE